MLPFYSYLPYLYPLCSIKSDNVKLTLLYIHLVDLNYNFYVLNSFTVNFLQLFLYMCIYMLTHYNIFASDTA